MHVCCKMTQALTWTQYEVRGCQHVVQCSSPCLQYSDRTWPVIILGSIMFIPGAYHVRLAYCAFVGYHGYSYDDIPEFE